MADTIDASTVFNPLDFQSIELAVQLQNFTTKTEIKDSGKIQLVQILDKALVFDMPRKSCNEKHSVMISITKRVPGKKQHEPLLNVTGKVSEVEALDDMIRATVECVQYDEQSWSELVSLFSKRQEEITNFLAAAKGL